VNDEKNIDASHGKSVLEAFIGAGIDLNHSCGGMGTCGTCRIIVENSAEKVAPRNQIELEMAEARQFSANERLACQLTVQSKLRIRKP
jgi:2Fe-2S ferredoxin